ncbi:hypothetical protein [Rhodococcus sp. YH1]|uniref:hypothetical protein n=1 Tax=Rhodococcus sp. YH1 TaxID=89066 RepID=UPI0013867EF4|nr:hypothetical protein [Rhodococcus sp. YH1]NCL78800.1 hypothetical protein [Rhodococcus sp. YH1]
MITLRLPYGGGSITVADDVADRYLSQGWVQVGAAQPATVSRPLPDPPPRTGKGSGVKEWQKYALALGIASPEDAEATRDEIIARIEAAGFAVDRTGDGA